MSMIIQVDLQSILENRIAFYISLGLLFTVVAIVLYLQSRRRGQARSRTIAHLEAIRLDVRSINQNAAKLIELLSFAASYKDDRERIESGLAQLHTVCVGTNEAIQTVPSATAEKLSDLLQQQEATKREAEQEGAGQEQARQEREVLQRRQIRIEAAHRRYEALSESEVCRISALVADISEGLGAQSALTNGCEKAIRPYLELASKVKDAARTIAQLDPTIEDVSEPVEFILDSLEQAARDLSDRHRPAWCIGLLDLARRSPSVEGQSKDLENLLGLEEVCLSPGSDLRDYKLLKPEVVDSDGDGSKSVITELVEVGYKNAETGVVLRQPKVKVRFEG